LRGKRRRYDRRCARSTAAFPHGKISKNMAPKRPQIDHTTFTWECKHILFYEAGRDLSKHEVAIYIVNPLKTVALFLKLNLQGLYKTG
jgi:hypothetical protein